MCSQIYTAVYFLCYFLSDDYTTDSSSIWVSIRRKVTRKLAKRRTRQSRSENAKETAENGDYEGAENNRKPYTVANSTLDSLNAHLNLDKSNIKCKAQPRHALLGYPFRNTAAHT